MKSMFRTTIFFLLFCSGVLTGETELKPELLPSYNDSQVGFQIARVYGYEDNIIYTLSTEQEVIEIIQAQVTQKTASMTIEDMRFASNKGLGLYCVLGCSGNGADDIRQRSVKKAILREMTIPRELDVEVDLPEIRSVPFEGRFGTTDIMHVIYRVDLSHLPPGRYKIRLFENVRVIEEDVTKAEGENRKVISETRNLAKKITFTID